MNNLIKGIGAFSLTYTASPLSREQSILSDEIFTLISELQSKLEELQDTDPTSIKGSFDVAFANSEQLKHPSVLERFNALQSYRERPVEEL